MRDRIIRTVLVKPAKLKYHHPIGTPVTLIDKYKDTKTGQEIWFNAPKVDGMYFERAEEFIKLAISKKQLALSSIKATNPKDQSQGQSFFNSDDILDFFELSTSAITLIHAGVEFTVNRYIEEIKNCKYKYNKYVTVLHIWEMRLQIKKEITLPIENMLYLPLEEKIKFVLPLHYEFETPSTQSFWQEFSQLKYLRDSLLHITRKRSYGAIRKENSVFAQLLEVDLEKILKNVESLVQYIEKKCIEYKKI